MNSKSQLQLTKKQVKYLRKNYPSYKKLNIEEIDGQFSDANSEGYSDFQSQESSISVASKKSIKQAKIRKKQTQGVESQNSAFPKFKYSAIDQEISSVSFRSDIPFSDDSLLFRLASQPQQIQQDSSVEINQKKDMNKIEQNSEPELKQQSPQSQFLASPIFQQHMNQADNYYERARIKKDEQNFAFKVPQASAIKNKINFKVTSLHFPKMNRYVSKFLEHQKKQGLIVYPQYSTVAEEQSELQIQGQEVALKGTKPFGDKSKLRFKNHLQQFINILDDECRDTNYHQESQNKLSNIKQKQQEFFQQKTREKLQEDNSSNNKYSILSKSQQNNEETFGFSEK